MFAQVVNYAGETMFQNVSFVKKFITFRQRNKDKQNEPSQEFCATGVSVHFVTGKRFLFYVLKVITHKDFYRTTYLQNMKQSEENEPNRSQRAQSCAFHVPRSQCLYKCFKITNVKLIHIGTLHIISCLPICQMFRHRSVWINNFTFVRVG